MDSRLPGIQSWRLRLKTLRLDTEESQSDDRWTIPGFYFPAVSPDGSRIAYATDSRLVIIDNSTGDLREEFILPAGKCSSSTCAWSPDGRNVAVAKDGADAWGIWIINFQARELRQLAEGRLARPAWSSDGSKLSFVAIDLQGDRILYTVESEDLEAIKPDPLQPGMP